MKLKFKIEKGDRILVSDKYISNGHWLLTKEFCKNQVKLKTQVGIELNKVINYKTGTYWYGDDRPGYDPTKMINKLVKDIKKKEYKDTFKTNGTTEVAFKLGQSNVISSFRFKFNEDKDIGIGPRYLPLVNECSKLLVKSPLDPIYLVFDNKFCGLLMPCKR